MESRLIKYREKFNFKFCFLQAPILYEYLFEAASFNYCCFTKIFFRLFLVDLGKF